MITGRARRSAAPFLTLTRPWVQERFGEDEDPFPIPYQVLARWNIRDRAAKPDQIEHHDLFFTPDDLGGMEGIAKWMKAAEKYRSTLGAPWARALPLRCSSRTDS